MELESIPVFKVELLRSFMTITSSAYLFVVDSNAPVFAPAFSSCCTLSLVTTARGDHQGVALNKHNGMFQASGK